MKQQNLNVQRTRVSGKGTLEIDSPSGALVVMISHSQITVNCNNKTLQLSHEVAQKVKGKFTLVNQNNYAVDLLIIE